MPPPTEEESSTSPAVSYGAWDPKCPVLFQSPPRVLIGEEEEQDGDTKDEAMGGEGEPKLIIEIDRNYTAGSGAGCNIFESAAIMELLQARNEYLRNNGAIGSYPAMQELCRKYCQALYKCNLEWSKYRDNVQDDDEGDVDMEDRFSKSSLSHQNMDLLKIVYALTQLSATFLLLPNNKRSPIPGGSSLFNHYADMVQMDGAATADTVRFLRRHCLRPIDEEFDEEELQTMDNATQPEQWKGGIMFWTLVENAVARGDLEYARSVLKSHSCCKRVKDYEDSNLNETMDDFAFATLQEDKNGFEALMDILQSAPLPGGRSDSDDADLGSECQSGQTPDDTTEYISGVKASAYRYWDINPTSQDPDHHFEPREAYELWKQWQESITSNPHLKTLRKRIPQLNKSLDMMSGKLEGIEFDSWQEDLCAGLLYKTPNIKMDDMHARTARLMEHYPEPESTKQLSNDVFVKVMKDVIVKVMKGNAGEVLAFTSLLGGATSAALPAVMLSLLSQLFTDAKATREDETELHTIHAAQAIRSSFAVEAEDAAGDARRPTDFRDVGARVTVELLLPYIKVGNSLTFTAMLVDTLEHHFPGSDPEATKLLSLCEKLVERKNVRILDGCDSICLARYLHYKKSNEMGNAITWLIKGAELEALLYCGPNRTGAWQTSLSAGVCFRRLVAEFSGTALTMLRYLVGGEDDGSATDTYQQAKEMIESQQESSITPYLAEVKVLGHVAAMAKAISEKLTVKMWTTHVASNIVACLEEKCDDEDNGTVSSLAPPCMQWDLLRLATLMLERDAAKGDMEATASFDVAGMGTLLSCFTMNVEGMKMTNELDAISSEKLYKMRLAFGEGLKRSFIAENAEKAVPEKQPSKLSADGVYAAQFGNYSPEVQELAVKNMLDRY